MMIFLIIKVERNNIMRRTDARRKNTAGDYRNKDRDYDDYNDSDKQNDAEDDDDNGDCENDDDCETDSGHHCDDNDDDDHDYRVA